MVNNHTRSAENWKCVWYFLRPIDDSSACAKRRYTPINVAASQCFEWTEWGACRADCGVYYCCFQCCSFTLFRMDRVGACRADCGVYYCCFQCSSFAVLRMDRVCTTKIDACVCVSVCLCAKFDQFLPVRSHFDTKRPVNFFHTATFQSATFGRPLFAFVLCVLRPKIIKKPKVLGKRIDRRNR